MVICKGKEYKTLYEFITPIIKEKCGTQRVLTRATGIIPQTLSQALKGTRSFSDQHLETVAKFLELDDEQYIALKTFQLCNNHRLLFELSDRKEDFALARLVTIVLRKSLSAEELNMISDAIMYGGEVGFLK